jgi:hypothetical protein
MAQQPQQQNWLQRLVRGSSPQSTVGQVASNDPYKAYAIEMMTNGQEPVSRAEFMQMQAQQMQAR